MLDDDNWKYDVIPEIMDGENVIDYWDPAILAKLEKLEAEERAYEEMEEDEVLDVSLHTPHCRSHPVRTIDARRNCNAQEDSNRAQVDEDQVQLEQVEEQCLVAQETQIAQRQRNGRAFDRNGNRPHQSYGIHSCRRSQTC